MQDTMEHVGDLPWQVKAVALIGVPSTIALYLVYILASSRAIEHQNFARDLQQVQAQLADHAAVLKEHAALTAQAVSQGETIIRILRANCVNAALTPEQRERCFQ